MELWIRSQDKKVFTKISNLKYEEFKDTHIINGYYNNELDNYDLGEYSTKERAFEILDSIQTLVEEYYDCLDNKIVLTPVYTMPKE